MRILGLDLGKKTLGIAMSDSLLIAAHGLETFRFKYMDFEPAVERVAELVRENGVPEIALGLPLHLSGRVSEMADVALAFRDKLEKRLPGVKIAMVDERLTSALAARELKAANMNARKRRELIDAAAAADILETYLAQRKKGE